MAASPGGNSAESSTSLANRGGIPRGPGGVSSTALDTNDTLVAYDMRTKSFAQRTRQEGDIDALLPAGRRDPAQAAHGLPQARRRALRRRADGRRRLLRRLRVALPPRAADGDRRRGRRRGGPRVAHPEPPAQAAG